MLTAAEKEGFRKILNKLSLGEVNALKDTVTRKQVATHGKDEAIDAIVTFSETALELLKRRKLKRDVLFWYLAASKVPVNPAAEKHQLIRKILILWDSHFNDAEIEDTVRVEATVNRRMILPDIEQEVVRPSDLIQGSVIEFHESHRYHRSFSYTANTAQPATERANHTVNSTNAVHSVMAHTLQTRSTASDNGITRQSQFVQSSDCQGENRNVRSSLNTVQSVTAQTSQTRSSSENTTTPQTRPVRVPNSQRENRSIRNPKDRELPLSERAPHTPGLVRQTATENVVPHARLRDRLPVREHHSPDRRREHRSILHSSDTESTCLVTEQVAAEPVVPSQSQPDKNLEFGKQFVQWYYKILNSHNPSLQSTPDGEFGPQHFWSDCRLEMTSVVQGEKNSENFEGSDIVAHRFLALVKEERLLFNPNVDMDGIRVKSEPHGLVLVLTCGTLHRVSECLGVFEQLFGLVSDPVMDNNWKVKISKLTMKSSQNATMPKLECGEKILAIGH